MVTQELLDAHEEWDELVALMGNDIYTFMDKEEFQDFYKEKAYQEDAYKLSKQTKVLRKTYTMHVAVYLITGEWCYPDFNDKNDNELTAFLMEN